MLKFLQLLLVIFVLHSLAKAQPVTELQPNQTIAREIQGSDSHSYQITLKAGECVKIELTPIGIEMLWFLRGNTGRDDANYNNAAGYVIYIVAENAESWQLRVTPRSREGAGGHYNIRLVERRSATDADRNLFAAQSLSHSAIQQFIRGDATSLRESIATSQKAAQLWEKTNQQRGIGVMLNLIGLAYGKLDEIKAAQEFYEQAIIRFRAINDQKNEINSLQNRAELDVRLGQYQRALDAYQQAYEYGRAPGHEVSFIVTCLRLADIYRLTGELTRARDFYNEALAKSRQHRETNYTSLYEAQSLLGLGRTFASLGESEQALVYLQGALPAFARYAQTTNVFTADVQKASADIYLQRRQFEQASNLYQQALTTYQKFGHPQKIAVTANSLGQALLALGHYEAAQEMLLQGLHLSDELNAPEEKIAARIGLAHLTLTRDQGAALGYINDAIQIIEHQRTRLINPELRATFLARMQQAYEFKIDLLAQQKQFAAAFATSEQARARAWLEMLGESAGQMLPATDPALAARDNELRQRIANKVQEQARLAGEQTTVEQKERIKRELTLLLAEHDQLTSQFRQSQAYYRAQIQPQPLTLPEIQREVLDEKTLLLEYSLGEKNSYLFAVTTQGMQTFVLPSRTEIEPKARAYYQLMESYAKPPAFKNIRDKQQWTAGVQQKAAALAQELSQILLAPAQALFANQRLLIVPDGALHYVPFAALPAPQMLPASARQRSQFYDEPLIASREILMLPSASTLTIQRRRFSAREPAPKTLALLADPVFENDDPRLLNQPSLTRSDSGTKWLRLPATRLEAEALQSLVPKESQMVAMGFAANLTAATSAELQKFRYIHFATHGLFDNEHPELSSLVFSQRTETGQQQNGYLRTMDVFKLKLNAELVVLSGCRTGLGKELSGEGWLGLTRGFMYAGAKRVMASLWQVDDAATAQLMKCFYERLLSPEKLSPTAALRAAQLEMLQSKQWNAPYYWAAFTLQGDW